MKLDSLDIFCDIIDNYGDIGVVYRLAKEFKNLYGDEIEIRVILNRIDEFLEINKKAKNEEFQKIDGITYMTEKFLTKNICTINPANVIIEAFGCSIFEGYLEKAKSQSTLLINLEYLSGESWIEDVHLMESLMGAPKLRKYFFMPGFSEKSGGVIVDSLFLERKRKVLENKEMYLEKYLSDVEYKNRFIGTVFTYEKNFEPLIESLEKNSKENLLLIMGEKSKKSFDEVRKKYPMENIGEDTFKYKNIMVKYMPFLNQEEYEEVINMVDYNLVRGEDSFVRAVITGKPFLWHIYLQEEMAHMDKIEGFIERYEEVLGRCEIVNIHTKLLRDYNFRDSNSFERGKEEFDDFFKNFQEIDLITKNYSDFIISKCNLIDKLKNFILKYQEV